jgi:hypothetical protein
VANLQVPQGTIIIYVGARDLSGSEAGQGGEGGYSAGGSSSWFSLLASRGMTGYSIWGGSIAFDSTVNWYFGTTASGLTTSETDFYTVATHELGHVLGFGTSSEFQNLISDQTFTGANATAMNGGTPPKLSPDLYHFAEGTTFDSQPVSMQPYLIAGERYGFTSLDYAVLADIGWSITSATTTTTSPPTTTTTVPPVTSPIVAAPAPSNDQYPPIVLTGSDDGLAYIERYINGQLVEDPTPYQPFPNFTGELRSVVADVNGDGIDDIVYATGAGGPSEFTIIDGATGNALITPEAPFGTAFTGGLYVAAGDFGITPGSADIVVSADNGGGGRVSIFSYASGAVTRIGDFMGIADPNFRGGSRVTTADVNGDGVPDLIVGAGFGGGPRVAIFDGTTITQPSPTRLVGDFFAFPTQASTLRNGVFIAAADINGDGKADLIFGAGPGGGPQVIAISGAEIMAGDLADAFNAPLLDFFAGNTSDRGGVHVGVIDVDGDGQLDLVTGSGTTGNITWYKSFNVTQPQTTQAIPASSSTPDGVYVPPMCGCPLCRALLAAREAKAAAAASTS